MKGRQHIPSHRYKTTIRQEFLQRHLEAEPEWKLYKTWRRGGIRAEFHRTPPTYTFPNKFTPMDEVTIEGIQHMLKEGWIKEIKDWQQHPGHYSKLKLVKKASGKWRFTLACVEINKYTVKRRFKVDDLRTLKELLEPGMYMGLMDIKDAFYSKAQQLHMRDQIFFRFAIKDQTGSIRVYQFRVTPQGWSSSPRALHIMLREAKNRAIATVKVEV